MLGKAWLLFWLCCFLPLIVWMEAGLFPSGLSVAELGVWRMRWVLRKQGIAKLSESAELSESGVMAFKQRPLGLSRRFVLLTCAALISTAVMHRLLLVPGVENYSQPLMFGGLMQASVILLAMPFAAVYLIGLARDVNSSLAVMIYYR